MLIFFHVKEKKIKRERDGISSSISIFSQTFIVCLFLESFCGKKSSNSFFYSGSHSFRQLRSRLLAATYNGLPKGNNRNSNNISSSSNEAGRMELFSNGDKDRDGALNYNEVGRSIYF